MREKYRYLVHRILLENHDARNSDDALFDAVMEVLTPELRRMEHRIAIMHDDYPNRDSVTRARRFWQERDENCMSDKQVARGRAKRELEYREEYGRGYRVDKVTS